MSWSIQKRVTSEVPIQFFPKSGGRTDTSQSEPSSFFIRWSYPLAKSSNLMLSTLKLKTTRMRCAGLAYLLLLTLLGACEFLNDLTAFPGFDLFARIFHEFREPAGQFVNALGLSSLNRLVWNQFRAAPDGGPTSQNKAGRCLLIPSSRGNSQNPGAGLIHLNQSLLSFFIRWSYPPAKSSNLMLSTLNFAARALASSSAPLRAEEVAP